jgi:hypothetical protein
LGAAKSKLSWNMPPQASKNPSLRENPFDQGVPDFQILGIWKYKQAHYPTQNFRYFLSTKLPGHRKKDSTTGGE